MKDLKKIALDKLGEKIKSISLSIALTILTSACGGQAYTDAKSPSANSTLTGNGISQQTPWTTFSGTPSTTPSTAATGSSPAITKSFTLQGTGGYNTNYPFTANYKTSYTYENISADSRLVFNLTGTNGSTNTTGSAVVQAQYLNSQFYTGCRIYSTCEQISIAVLDHVTQKQVGSNITISANVTSTDGKGSCGGLTTATPSFDASQMILGSGHGSIDVQISQIQSVLWYNSCAGGNLYSQSGYAALLPYNYIQSGVLIIHTDTTQ